MSRHECKGELCGTCARAIEQLESGDRGYSDRELDQYADGAAADMVYGREW